MYLNVVKFLHSKLISKKRLDILCARISKIIPDNVKTVLDIGCGNGELSFRIANERHHLFVTGLEVIKNKDCAIPCRIYNGDKIPLRSNSVDLCLLVDVLHHNTDIPRNIAEAKRVSKRYLIIKDHAYKNLFGLYLLRIMDWVGNKPYGVGLPFNYQKKSQWLNIFKSQGLKVLKFNEHIPVHFVNFDKIFHNKFHFVTLLEKT